MPPGTMQSIRRDDALVIEPLTGIVGFTLRMAQIKIFEDFDRRIARMQLRPAEYSVLTLIKHNPGCHASQVAEILKIKRPNFVALLAGLEERNLVTRRRSQDDKRVFHLHTTKYGNAFVKKADVVVAQQEKQIADILGAAGKVNLVDMLVRLQNLPVDG